MSGVHRFLSRRDKKAPRHASPSTSSESRSASRSKPAPQPTHFGSVFSIEDDPKVKPDKEEERKIAGILERLRNYGIDTMAESNARYALRITRGAGEGEEAFRLLMLLQETYEGIVKPYQPQKKLLGAANREGVTCYLDALLFAMFARLDSFEAMLYDSFEDVPRKRLAGLLRLWVNMLRSGRLITTDITRHMQDAMSACGWQDAARLKQQDPSEAFTFITGQLELPLLTLKMDLYHAGKEDPQDDHKFVNERLLEVALLHEPPDGGSVITLEDCLEHYFNNRLEVKRHMENQRRNTLKSGSTEAVENGSTKIEKESGIHVEVAEVGPSGSNTPISSTPITESPITPSMSKGAVDRIRPALGRKRGDSIFSQRKVEVVYGFDPDKFKDEKTSTDTMERKLSTRTEVLMPAWQFFKLLPWYTDHMPTSDAQVAAHFSKKRPVLGICLKRYSYTNTGQARRLNTYIDIPLEIAVPNFVSDDNMADGPLVGNFRLLLQSVVCHRGVSVNSGHYICLCRGQASNAVPESQPSSRRGSTSESDDVEDPWMRFDDLAKERVTYVDIREALRQETPYLLFYQVQPIGDDGHSIHNLPSYAEATSRSQSDVMLPEEKTYMNSTLGSENALVQVPSRALSDGQPLGSEATDWAPTSRRTSLDASAALEGPRGRTSMNLDERRASTILDGTSVAGSVSGGSTRAEPTASVPSTPNDESGNTDNKTNFLAIASMASKLSSSRRASRLSKESASKSRPTSIGPDGSGGSNGRFSLNMTKLTQKISRNEMSHIAPPEEPAATVTVSERSDDIDGESTAGIKASEATARNSITLPREDVSHEDKTAAHSKSHSATLKKKEQKVLKAGKRKKSGPDDRECSIM